MSLTKTGAGKVTLKDLEFETCATTGGNGGAMALTLGHKDAEVDVEA